MEGKADSSEELMTMVGEEEVRKEEKVHEEVDERRGTVANVSKEQLKTTGSRPTTMASEQNAISSTPDQLTIFYSGRVLVFDGIAAEKVREIVLLATAAAAAIKPGDMNKIASGSGTPILTRSPSLQGFATATATAGPSQQAQLFPIHKNSLRNLQAELPIARKHSLQRFFEKRRDRLVSKNPYHTPTSPKTAETPKPDFNGEASADAEL